jgi:hypothetical protein
MSKENLKTYFLETNEEEAVDAIALVFYPAIERDFFKFNKTNLEKQTFSISDPAEFLFNGGKDTYMKFKVTDKRKRLLTGLFMEADKRILRPANDIIKEEHYVAFSSEEIEKIMIKFFKGSNHMNINLEHDDELEVDGSTVYESWRVRDPEKDITTTLGYTDVTVGSWAGSIKIDNEKVWNNKIDPATGEPLVKGFSVQGMFSYAFDNDQFSSLIKETLFNKELNESEIMTQLSKIINL